MYSGAQFSGCKLYFLGGFTERKRQSHHSPINHRGKGVGFLLQGQTPCNTSAVTLENNMENISDNREYF